MDKWFEDKFERNNLRKYTTRRIKNNFNVDKFLRMLSITNWFIAINLIVYLFFSLFKDKLISIFALQANDFFSGTYWTLVTSMFSHVWLPHLLFNMISLFFVGNFLEKIIGRKKFFWFYLFSGIFAGLFFAVLSFYFGRSELGARIFVAPDSYSVGASGAIFGIAGLLAILTPFMRVYLIAGPIFAIIFQSILSSFFQESQFLFFINILITFYIFFSIFSMFSFNPNIRKFAIPMGMPFWLLPIVAIVPLVVIGLFVQLPIGNTAHLGGLLSGLAYGYFLKRKYRKKTELIKRYFR